jgi:1-deoxy-D-xylulose-5-phosphate reductoisomerase
LEEHQYRGTWNGRDNFSDVFVYCRIIVPLGNGSDNLIDLDSTSATTDVRRNVAVLGSTGSIGTATIEVLRQLGQPYRVWALTAHRNRDELLRQVLDNRPRFAALTSEGGEASRGAVPRNDSGETEWLTGTEALVQLAEHPDVDIVVAGIVGSAGLESSLAAVRAGKTLALANKESLVVAGPLLTRAAQDHGARILPVDSEHSAVFQALHAGNSAEQVDRIVLTASGGSLRDRPLSQLDEANVDEVLSHPNWSMGRKITVDSATMMNKALEVIEARWLFNIDPAKISVVVHPQSIIHSMVEFVDGSIVAQLSPPDMKLPIQYALTYPDRVSCPAKRLDWSSVVSLDWKPADLERYPALELGFEAARVGGTVGAVLNAANEAAVELFLNGAIRFTEIASICRDVMKYHHFDPSPTLEELTKQDRWARQEVAHRRRFDCKNTL